MEITVFGGPGEFIPRQGPFEANKEELRRLRKKLEDLEMEVKLLEKVA